MRAEVGITQERLAWDCDLSNAYLSQVESGKRLPSIAALDAIARRLGVEMADLLAFDLDGARLRLLDAARRGDHHGVREALRALGIRSGGRKRTHSP